MALQVITYVEHYAGTFEDGLQICVHCGKMLCDYTGNWMSADGSAPSGYPEGPLFQTGTNPVQSTIERPLENYGNGDPYSRVIQKCI